MKKNNCVSCAKCGFAEVCQSYLFDHQEPMFIKDFARKKRIAKNEFIYQHGTTVKALYALRRGVAKIYDAQQTLQGIVFPGQVIGAEELFSEHYQYSVQAATEVEICELQNTHFYHLSQITSSFTQTDKFGPGKNGFTNGDPATGRRATDLNSDMWDAVQEEICTVIESSGLTLNKDQHDQLYQAIVKTVTSKIPDALIRNKNLSDLVDKVIARTNLGLGGLAIKEIGYIYDSIYPVGVVTWFAQNKNPNTLFPGTKWNYIGENWTIRLASANGSDVMAMGGSDSVTLAVGNLPAHGHTFSANTSSFDYGTKSSNSTGAHTHTISGTAASAGDHSHAQRAWRNGGGGNGVYIDRNVFNTNGNVDTSSSTVNAGAHTHSISGSAASAGAHAHTTAIGAHGRVLGRGVNSTGW